MLSDTITTQAKESGIRNQELEAKRVTHFTELVAWQLGSKLTKKVYEWTKKFPREEKYGVTAQLRDSCVSITSNIAEGFGRYHWNDKKKFYINARGSAFEAESQIIESSNLGFLNKEELKEGVLLCRNIQKSLNGLIRKMNNPNS